MPNPKPRGKGILESRAIARLRVPEVVHDPQTPADRLYYGGESIDGWRAVLIAVNPAYMTAKRRKQILSDFNRLLTILIWEEEAVVKRQETFAAVVRRWHGTGASGKRPSAAMIAKSLGMKHDEVRTIVRRIRAAHKSK